METSSKASKATRQLVAFLTAGVTLAMAALVGASTSTQVKQLDPLVVPRTGHAATALAPSDGRILITGGRDSAGNIVAVSEIFDPVANTSTASATLTTPRVNHTATLLTDGRVLVAGGSDTSGPVNSAEIFDPAHPENGFRTLSATMGAARAGHTATVLGDGTVLIAGGDAAGTAEIFDPTAETFSSTLLTMAAPRTGHTATLFSDNSVLLAGGNTDSMELFTPADQKFTLDSQVMSVVHIGQDAISLSDTRLLFVGGDTTNTIDEFNRTADTVTTDATMAAASSSGTLLANGSILVLGANMAGLYAPNAADLSTAFTAFDETSVPGSSVLPRTGQTATQLSGDKKILVAGGKNAQNLFVTPALFNPARIWTDKDDYQPGDNVVLSGSGWKPSENVYLYAVDSQTEAWTYGSTVTADANGAFVVNPYFVVQLVQQGAAFSVSSVGAQSNMQAEVKFTDAGIAAVTVVGAQTPNPVLAGSTATYGNGTAVNSVNVTFNGNTASCGVTLSASGLPAGAAAAFTPNPISSTGAQVNSLLTVSTTAGTTPPGTYTFTVTATAGGTCSGTNKSTTATLVVTGQSTVLSANTASGTYGGTSGNLSATLTSGGNPLSGKTVSFKLNGNTIASATTAASGLASVSGVSLCGTSYNAGNYPSGVAASFAGDTTYNAASGSAALTISKANATVVVTPYTVTYDGNAHTATVTSITGVCSETGGTVGTVSVTGTTHTSANNSVPYSDTWTFTPTANYNTITTGNTITDTINQATPTFSGLTASQTIDCGTATISLSGKLGAGAGPTAIAPTGEMATITVDGAPVATSTGFVGTGGSFSATVNTSSITGGPYNIVYHYAGDANFNPASNSSTQLTVNDCNVNTSMTVTSSSPLVAGVPTSTYGDPVTFTATVTAASGSNPPTGSLNFVIAGIGTVAGTPGTTTSTTATWTYMTSALNAGTHTVSASYVHTGNFVDSNGSLSGGQTVNKKTLTASITGDPTKPYDGNTDATGLTSANFSFSGLVGTDNFTVTKTTGSYNSKDVATANTVTTSLAAGDFTPVGGTLASNYTLPTTASGPGQITPVTLTASIIGNPTKMYNCNPVATLTSANFSLSGLIGTENFTVNQTAGTYNSKDVVSANTVTASLAAGDFTGTNGGIATNYVLPTTASGPGRIIPTDATISVTAYTSATTTFDCTFHTATGTAMGCDGDLGSLLNFSGTSHKDAGDYPGDSWTFNAGSTNPNYNSAGATIHDSIDKAHATIHVMAYHVTYDCNAHTATGTAAGCVGDLSSLLDLSGTTHTNAGTFNGDAWSFAGNANYYSDNGTVDDSIAKADTTSSVTSNVNPSIIGQPVTFTATVAGNPAVTCNPTGTVTFKDGGDIHGVGGTILGTGTLNGSSQATFSTSSLSAGNHNITAVYSGDSNFNATGATPGSTATIYPQSVHYVFVGFFQPVDNPPTVNSVKAGQVIPVKWQLKDFAGNLIGDLSTLAPSGLQSQRIACDTYDPIDAIEELAAPGSTVFRFDGTQFIYNWQTSKSWAGTCRLMTVTLSDGTTHTAQFTFK